MNEARCRSIHTKGRRPAWPRAAIAAAFATVALFFPLKADAHAASAALISVELYDRTSGAGLQVYGHDGQRFVVGTPGHEYAIRIRNRSAGRILAVTSVDGVNVVSGETASPDQSGYVIDAGASVEIEGWRRSLERTAAFYFTDLGASYAARTGRPGDVGVVGVAVFRERVPSVVAPSMADKLAAQSSEPRRTERAAAAPLADAPHEAVARDERARETGAGTPKLGTGFGRTETSYAQRVRFDRATDTPVETVAIRYDRRENLAAMGVLPTPRYAERIPDPFPAMRFVPEPGR